MNSPLGKYAQEVAAILALLVIGGWLADLLAASFLPGVTVPPALQTGGMVAFGAVFGSAAAVNGVKGSIVAAHARLDKIGAPQADPTAGQIDG